ncbi:MAG: histidine kinase dimerization/phosphoacceptor domain -containing protein [Flavisolibacter sp.]
MHLRSCTYSLAILVTLLPACTKTKSPPLPAEDLSATQIRRLLDKASSFSQSHYDSLHFYAQKALDAATQTHNIPLTAEAWAQLSSYQRKKGNYADAVATALKALRVFDSLSLHKQQVKTQLTIADIYKEMGGERGTLDYLKKGLAMSVSAQQVAERTNDDYGRVLALNEQGIILRDFFTKSGESHYIDSAFNRYRTALKIVETSAAAEPLKGKLYNNISQVYNEHYKDYPKALDYLEKAVAFNSARNNLNSLSFNYGNLSDVYLNMNRPAQARFYAQQMLAATRALQAPHRLLNAYSMLVRVNKKLGRFDSALYYKEKFVVISDSLTNVEKTAQVTEMNTRYETLKKEAKIAVLSELNTIAGRRLWYALGAAALLLLLLTIAVRQNRRLKKQKEMISSQSAHLQWLMKELHHRVKNNLQIVSSILNLQTYRISDEETISALKESQLRVKAMSLIHQRLYQVQDSTLVNFKLYLEDLAETLMQAYGYGGDDFDLCIKVEKELLDVDTVMPLGLLVNEILTNAFKYAFDDVSRPALHIAMKEKGAGLELEIKDNGPGMQPHKAQQTNGFGRKLIDALTKQLKGSYTVDAEDGLAYNFRIPYTKKHAA